MSETQPMTQRDCGACEEHQHVCIKHHERVLEELRVAEAALAAMTAERDAAIQGRENYVQLYRGAKDDTKAAAERLAQIEAHAKWLQLLIETSGDPVVVATLQPVLALLQPVRGAGEEG